MRVRIFQPPKSAMQSGRAGTHEWRIEPQIPTARQPEPLMGWISSGDTYGELRGRLRFDTPEEAIAFAKDKGWEMILEQPLHRKVQPRNYLDNFRIVRPEDEERQKGK